MRRHVSQYRAFDTSIKDPSSSPCVCVISLLLGEKTKVTWKVSIGLRVPVHHHRGGEYGGRQAGVALERQGAHILIPKYQGEREKERARQRDRDREPGNGTSTRFPLETEYSNICVHGAVLANPLHHVKARHGGAHL